jgi:hypothetical protein
MFYTNKMFWTNVNLRVEVGKHPQVILATYKNNERPDWMTDLKHTDSAW